VPAPSTANGFTLALYSDPVFDGGGRFVGIDAPGAPRHDSGPVLEVGRKDTVKAGEIQARPRHQGSQPGDKVQRLQHHVGRPIPERLFVLIHDTAPDP
jgi:hypothetical protein